MKKAVVVEKISEQPIRTFWWLVRHGPVVNPRNLVYGKTDWSIETENSGLYKPLAKILPREATYLTSTRGRTVKTLAHVAKVGNFALPDFTQVPEFDEQSFGSWEGQTWDELFRKGCSHAFWLAPAHECPPGGESFDQVIVRVARGLEQQSILHEGKTLVLFAHGGTIRAALSHALGLDGETALRFSIDHCSITRLTRWRLSNGILTWQVVHVNLSPP